MGNDNTKATKDIFWIPITTHGVIEDKSNIYFPFTSSTTISQLFKHICDRYSPKLYKIKTIEKNSFITKNSDDMHSWSTKYHQIEKKLLIDYNQNDINKLGLKIHMSLQKYVHNVKQDVITCPHMKSNKNMNDNAAHGALQCPIYTAMKIGYQFTARNLDHLHGYQHFNDEFKDKPTCKYNQKCRSWIRCENQENKIADLCHLKLYRHPPKDDEEISIAENINTLIINTKSHQNNPIYEPTNYDDNKYKYNNKDGYLHALIEEVVSNGYKYDLCLECSPNDECKHSDYSILKIVDQKLKCARHKIMGEPLRRDHMLALILYTGCECNYDLCKSQRHGDFNKWKWFDLCLYEAIARLSKHETRSYKVFSGLNSVKLSRRIVDEAFFTTYVSSSWNKDIATVFMGDEGMLFEFDKTFRKNVICCDVSWISKFPDECEILFARSVSKFNGFQCEVMD
eukprot:300573_1